MNAQIAAGAKSSMQGVSAQIELDNSTQLQMQQVSSQVAADNQAYFAQQESNFNASQGLRDLPINGEYSIQTSLNQSLQKSLANLQLPQVNFSVGNGAATADSLDYSPYTFYGNLQMRRQLESQGLNADQINAQVAVYENPPATTGNSEGNTELNNLLYNTPLEQLLANPPPKGPSVGPPDYQAEARYQETLNRLNAIDGSPLGATFSVIGSSLGASQKTQDGLLLTGTMIEGFGMSASGLKGGAPAFTGTQAGIDESLLIPPESRAPLPQSPNAYMRNNANILATYVDPLTGILVPATGSLSADHIVPQDWLISQPGFATMTPDQQDWVLNHPLNTQGLPQSFNSSKGASLPGDWSMHKGQPLDPGYVQNQAAQGQFIQSFMTNWVNQFNKMNGK